MAEGKIKTLEGQLASIREDCCRATKHAADLELQLKFEGELKQATEATVEKLVNEITGHKSEVDNLKAEVGHHVEGSQKLSREVNGKFSFRFFFSSLIPASLLLSTPWCS